MNKKTLIIIKSPLNDLGSQSYLNKIKSVKNESYSDKLNILEYECSSQDTFDDVLANTSDKVLLLDPHNFKVMGIDKHRMVEDNQTAKVVVDMICQINDRTKDEILVIGDGIIGSPIINDLRKEKYCVTVNTSKFIPYKGYYSRFDTIVNCVKNGVVTTIDNNRGIVYDVCGKCKVNGDATIIEKSLIGTLTVEKMINDVLNS